jgi:hypothetical protein
MGGYRPAGEGLPASGQPMPMQPGEFQSAAWRPRLFGQGYRELVGVPKIVTVNQPAAGSDWIYTHSGPSWFLLRHGVATLTTSSTVANRGANVAVKYTGQLCGQFAALVVQAASSVFLYCFSDAPSTSANTGTVPIITPDALLIKDGMSVGSSTALIQAADQWSSIALFVEEFTDRCLDL